jgi:capsular polysaccharide biosynthesis protein
MFETRQKQTLRPMIPDSSDTIDISGFARYLYQRRKFIVLTSTVSVALAGIASFLTPFKYTATASILIEPPAGNDPRGAMAVSTVYLESLKTYERFASSDSLFRQALAQLGLRSEYSGVPIESLKRRMLKVEKPKDEKILEISATLPNKRKAQKLAEYIADQTIAMNRSFENHSIAAISRDSTDLVQAAQATLQQTRLKREKFLREQPVAPVEEELAIMADLKVRAERNLADAQGELAATLARIKSQPADQGSGSVTKDDVLPSKRK